MKVYKTLKLFGFAFNSLAEGTQAKEPSVKDVANSR